MKQHEFLAIQRDIALELGSSDNLEEACTRLLEHVIGLKGIDVGGLYRVGESGDLKLIAYKGEMPASFVKKIEYFPSDSAQAKVVQQGKVLYMAPPDPLIPADEFLKEVKMIGIYPIKEKKGEVIAAFYILSHQSEELDPETATLLEAVTAHIGAVVSRITAEEELRRIKSQLDEQLSFVQNLTNTIPTPIFYIDAKGIYRGCNDAFAKDILGLSKERIVGHSLFELPEHISEELAGKYHALDMELIKHPGRKIYESRVRCADGLSRDFRLYRASFLNNKGEVGGVISTMTDITDLRKKEAELKKERNLSRNYLNTAEVMLIALDLNGNVSLANRKATEVLGLPASKIVGKNWFDNFLPERIREDMQKVFLNFTIKKNAIYNTFENPVITAEGEERIIQWNNSYLKDTNGEITGILSSGTDITEHTRTEENAVKMERYFRAAFNNSGVAMIIADAPAGKIRYVNNSVWDFRGGADTQMEGLTIDEYIGPWTEFTPEGRRYTGREMPLSRAILNGETIKGEERIIKLGDGSKHWTLANASPIKNEKGDIVAGIVAFVDITERKKNEIRQQELMEQLEESNLQLERAIEEANEIALKAERANMAKSEFLADMSHELRTPLNSIIGFSEAMLTLKADNLDEKQLRYISNISKSGKHLLNLINDILDISKVEAGKMDLDKELFSVSLMFNDVRELLSPMAKAKGINLKFETEPGDLQTDADIRKIKQIMYNLISNALKFTNPEGTIETKARKYDTGIQVSVHDNGIGIPEEKLEAIFNPFSQVSSSMSRDSRGTGLGLTLTKRFVELHGGSIRVKSEPDNGTTFIFTLP
jgi:PAS domain S-box-containing protein